MTNNKFLDWAFLLPLIVWVLFLIACSLGLFIFAVVNRVWVAALLAGVGFGLALRYSIDAWKRRYL